MDDHNQVKEEVAPNKAFVSVSVAVIPQLGEVGEDGKMPERTYLDLFPTFLRFGEGGPLEHPFFRSLGEVTPPLITMVVKAKGGASKRGVLVYVHAVGLLRIGESPTPKVLLASGDQHPFLDGPFFQAAMMAVCQAARPLSIFEARPCEGWHYTAHLAHFLSVYDQNCGICVHKGNSASVDEAGGLSLHNAHDTPLDSVERVTRGKGYAVAGRGRARARRDDSHSP
jgi:hypothetical protein